MEGERTGGAGLALVRAHLLEIDAVYTVRIDIATVLYFVHTFLDVVDEFVRACKLVICSHCSGVCGESSEITRCSVCDFGNI